MGTQIKAYENQPDMHNSKEPIFIHKTLEERASNFDGTLMLDGEYDWGKSVGKEIW